MNETLCEMVDVPAGTCTLGIADLDQVMFRTKDHLLFRDRMPYCGAREVVRVARFQIGMFPVSAARFLRWIQSDHGADFFASFPARRDHLLQRFLALGEDQRDQPAVGVHVLEAEAFARHSGMRLPTCAEWIRAARGDSLADSPTSLEGIHWTDDEAGGRLLQFLSLTRPSPYTNEWGIVDLLGNVAELTSTTLPGSGRNWRIVMETGMNAPYLSFGAAASFVPVGLGSPYSHVAPHHGFRLARDA